MKKVYLLLLLCVASIASYGQTAASYQFSRSSGTFASISGDVGVNTLTSGGMISDDGTSIGLPIGFTFYFSGTPYSSLDANANGWVSLSGGAPAGDPYDNSVSNIGGPGFLMPFWNDLYGGTSGGSKTAYYETTGLAGSRVFTIEYNDWSTCCNSGNASLYFQVKLYEGTGMIQFVYGSASNSPTSSSIGIANSSTDFQSLASGNATTTDTTTFYSSCSMPVSGSILQWCPVGVINGNPSVCFGLTSTLSSVYAGGTWSSSDPTIATVGSASGIVTGVAVGNANITYTPVCGTAGVAQVTVNPIPDVAFVSSQSICTGPSLTAPSSPVNFTGTYTATTTFNWVDDNPSIGIGTASGSGDISSFTATNAGSTPISSVFTVTPTRYGCVGTAQTFTITVNPYATVDFLTNQTLCNGTMTSAVIFSGPVPGTTYSWSNGNTSVGLGASGTGDTINAFTIIDTSSSTSTSAFVTVSSSANGCSGGSNTFTYIAKPTPLLTSAQVAPAICNGVTFDYTPTASTDPATSFTWSRAVVPGISDTANSGMGDPLEVLTDTMGNPNPETVVYVYVLSANGCNDTTNVSVVVNPTPMLSSTLTPAPICDSTMFTYIATSATSGTTFAWSRAMVAGITDTAGSGGDTIMEVLGNIFTYPVTVMYLDTLTANGCVSIDTISLVVNPKPTLTSPLTIAPICDSSSITYVPTSATSGTTFSWSRPAIPGGNPAASGGDTIMDNGLIDTSANPIVVVYYDTLKANGCMNVQTISLTVNPTPMLSSSLTPAGICDSTLFNYVPMSRTTGATFAWDRPFVFGIGSPAATGSGTVNEYLDNNTNDNLPVVYVYTITANGCHHAEAVTVVVHPTPTLASPTAWSACSGSDIAYVIDGYVFGTSYTWSVGSVTGLTATHTTGSGNAPGMVHDTLTNAGLTPLTAVYVFTLTANGCHHVEDVVLTVNPTPPSIAITTHSPGSLCSNTMYQNFGVASVPPASQHYNWTATNATVWATGADKQYCLVNFNVPGVTATVTLQSNLTGFGCTTGSSYQVIVGTGVSDNPQVIYFTGGTGGVGQFICLQTDEDNYQWGYDDATTLDSTILTGENNPNYINSSPDLTHRYYWVITNKGGCMQKTYYNVPTGITNINTGDNASIKVYPNPAKDVLNVDINTTLSGNYELKVVNMLGQQLSTTAAVDHKARIDVAGLPSGVYLVDCYRDGAKVTAVRFIKN